MAGSRSGGGGVSAVAVHIEHPVLRAETTIADGVGWSGLQGTGLGYHSHRPTDCIASLGCRVAKSANVEGWVQVETVY